MNVKYIAPLTDYSGYGEASRNAILALHKAGVGLSTSIPSFVSDRLDVGRGGELAQRCLNSNVPYDIRIIHLTPNFYADNLEPMKYHIGHLFWEVDGIDPVWVWNINQMDEIWTGCNEHAEMFKRHGINCPVKVMPQSMDTKFKPYKPLKLPNHDGFLFYSIFQWTERKNPKGLLETYWKTFEGVKDVSLLLKVYRADFSEPEKDVIRTDIIMWKSELGLDHYPRVLLYLDGMSRDKIMRLHATGDCFVSTHRGEGWGVPQMEAMISGNPIISTNYGGIHEWLTDQEAWLIPYKMVKVSGMEHIPWYNDSQLWADPNYGELARAMRQAYEDRKLTKRKGKKARKLVRSKFDHETVGMQMKKRLEEISKRL